MYELAKMQKHILDSLQAVEKKFADQFMEIEKDTARLGLLARINKLEMKIAEYGGTIAPSDAEKVEQLLKQVTVLKNTYCWKFTPAITAIIIRYESYTKSSLSVYYRLENITNQLSELQTGVKVETQPGMLGLKAIRTYADKLSEALKYNLVLEPNYLN